MSRLYKYPRTPHLTGSRRQPGDEDLAQLAFAALAGRWVVVEEKLDGANCAISFAPDGSLLLQSRGHFLAGGPREAQFALFKAWAGRYRAELWELLGARHVLYGEWLYAKHTIFYTDLPHYFLVFDLLDTRRGCFLSTACRRDLLRGAPFIASVPVLHAGELAGPDDLLGLLGPSRYVAADHAARLQAACAAHGLDGARAARETDPSGLMEGLYIKVERHGRVIERAKFVRASFSQTVLDAESHWLDRPLLPNRLRPGVDVFAPIIAERVP